MGYQFIPWVKSGTGAGVVPETLSETLPSSIRLPVSLRINNRHHAAVNVRLFGPGDIIGIDQRQIVRTDPRHNATNFEPNYFPAVEFHRPDFPWMFTPATGDRRGILRPWLCLVVVRVQEGVRVAVSRNPPLSVLTIAPPAQCATELPDLAESWAWAHAQVTGQVDPAAFVELLTVDTPRTISRLLCPVKLVANTRYYACLVPSFEAGRRAGLGLDAAPEDLTLAPAWRSGPNAPASVELPVYFQWEFATGAGGDFESLVRRLRGQPMPAGVGVRPMDVAGLGFGLPDLGRIAFEGALRAATPDEGGPDAQTVLAFKQTLRAILNATAPQAAVAEPVVAPTIYGAFHAAVQQVPEPTAPPVWLGDVNLDPSRRAAAALGTLVVQDQQELLMASAWEQLAGVKSAMQVTRQADLAREVGRKIFEKHLAPLSEPQLLEITTPVHARVTFTGAVARAIGGRAAGGVPALTVGAKLRETRLPRGVVTAAFRTTFRSGGPVTRRMAAVAPAAAAPPVMQRLVDRVVGPVTGTAPPPAIAFVSGAQIANQIGVVRARVGSGTGPELARFVDAADLLRAYLQQAPPPSLAPPPLPPPLAQVKEVLRAQLNPGQTVTTPAQARLAFGATESAAEEPRAILPHPEFPQPMYEALRDLSQDFLLPGTENVGADTVTLVQTNPEFIESFMLGLNHEMSRELLWREYPTDQRGTFFARFWDSRGGSDRTRPAQMTAIHRWDPDAALGQTFMRNQREGQLVLLIRGELFRRYPNTVVYAARAGSLDQPGADDKYPIFRGALEPDIVFVGFDLTEAAARGGGSEPGYYFVLQEQPADARFGLDLQGQFGADIEGLASWSDLTWGHIVDDAAAFDRLTHVPLTGRLTHRSMEGAEWGFNGAHMARITLQKRMRIAIHANELLPPRSSRP